MFTNYKVPDKNLTEFEDLTVSQKNKIVDLFAKGGTTNSIRKELLLPRNVVKVAISKVNDVENFCTWVAEDVTSITKLKEAARARFTSCEVTALDYLVGQIVKHADGTGNATFSVWKNGVLGIVN